MLPSRCRFSLGHINQSRVPWRAPTSKNSLARPLASLLGLLLIAGIAAGQTIGAQKERVKPSASEGLLVIVGPVLTLDPALPRAEAVVVRNGMIDFVGDARVATAEGVGRGGTLIRLPANGVVMPGIIDSHAHLLSIGRAQRTLDLRGTRSATEVSDAVRAATSQVPEGSWILGRGWNQEHWSDPSFPNRAPLDEAAPRHPVALTRVDGHALWLSSLALERAGITSTTRAPPGGEILKDSSGEPTGILIDNAMALAHTAIPVDHSTDTLVHDYLAAQDAVISHGITTLVDAGATVADLHVLNALFEDGHMKLRVASMLSVSNDADLDDVMRRNPITSLHDDRASVRSIKVYADGALGSRGAFLLEPYEDRPDSIGLSTTPQSLIESAAHRSLHQGWQVCVHAIGDRAVRETLDSFERALQDAPPHLRKQHRFRIEHAQIIAPKDIPRFGKLGVLPSMQAVHATSDAPWVEERIGIERAAMGAYAWRSLLDAGAIIPNGTDAPVESLSPWMNLFAAVTRLVPGPDGQVSLTTFHPEQRMNRLEALQSMTTSGAFGIFAEDRRGRIRPGFQGDLVILDRDPMTCSVFDLPNIKVLHTIIAGEIVYSAPQQRAVPPALQAE